MATSPLVELCSSVDDFGPEAVVLLAHPRSGVAAAVVVDNTACGPCIGGVRMAPDVTVDEVARLARAMTLKNAAARIPHGGAKAGICADPSMSDGDKETVIRWFAHAMRDIHSYIPGPDMGTNERCMAWIHDEIGRSVGLPICLGGLPLDELGATGFGLAIAAESAEAAGVVELDGARLAVQGFGAVGKHASRFLVERGATIVAVSDSRGAVANTHGLPLDELVAWKEAGQHLDTFDAEHLDRDAVFAVDCDIFVPAARPDVITEANVDDVKATVVLEGANLPVTLKAEARLHERGVLCLPDWIVNAGGVICASAEYSGGSRTQAFEQIDGTIRENTSAVIERSARSNRSPRAIAEELAVERIRSAMALRRPFPVTVHRRLV